MPKVGMEPIRRDALVRATIAEVGAAGSLDVSVAKIAKRAGMSSALAHHYFGNKNQIFLAAMRQILKDFQNEGIARLKQAETPAARVSAIIQASFAPSCFEPETVNAWMAFYGQAQVDADARRLLQVYQRRLASNLIFALRPLVSNPAQTAEGVGAMIDGYYLRATISDENMAQIIPHAIEAFVAREIGAS